MIARFSTASLIANAGRGFNRSSNYSALILLEAELRLNLFNTRQIGIQRFGVCRNLGEKGDEVEPG